MKKFAFVTVTLGTGLVLATLLLVRRGDASGDAPTVPVCRKDLVVTIVENGTVEASETRTVYAPIEGEITTLIDEGSDVKEGDVLARLSNEEIEEEHEEAKLDLGIAEAQLNQAKKAFALMRKRLDLTVKQRKAEAELAKWELESVRRKADETEIKRREMAVRTRKLQLEFAALELESAKLLMGNKSVGSIEDFKQKETAKRDAEVEYKRAKDLYESAKSEPNRKRLEVAVGRLQRAERFLAQATLNREEQVAVGAKDIDIQAANAKKLRDRVENLERDVALLEVASPTEGRVVCQEVFKGSSEERSRVRVGETRWRRGELMLICNIARMVVRAPVNECDISNVQVGQEARVRLLAYPEKRYHAKVIEILPHAVDKNARLGSLAMSRDGLAGVAVVDVLVEINDADENVRLGLTAEVEVTINVLKDALVIPHTAVQYVKGQPVCRRAGKGETTDRPIVLGKSNEFEVAVTDGLAEGDLLLDDACREVR